MLVVKTLTAPIIKLMWVLPEGATFKQDDYDATVVISIDIFNGYIELQGFCGYMKDGIPAFTRKQYREGLDYFRRLSEEYGLPVKAERSGKHRLPGFKLIDDWWVLGDL